MSLMVSPLTDEVLQPEKKNDFPLVTQTVLGKVQLRAVC